MTGSAIYEFHGEMRRFVAGSGSTSAEGAFYTISLFRKQAKGGAMEALLAAVVGWYNCTLQYSSDFFPKDPFPVGPLSPWLS